MNTNHFKAILNKEFINKGLNKNENNSESNIGVLENESRKNMK